MPSSSFALPGPRSEAEGPSSRSSTDVASTLLRRRTNDYADFVEHEALELIH